MSVPTPILQYTLSDATMKGLLPAGYTPLVYIESTGTQYINTGWYTNSYPLKLETIIVWTSYSGEKDFFGNFGSDVSSSSNCFVCGVASNKTYQWGGSVFYSDATPQIGEKLHFLFTYESGSRTMIMNGVSKSINYSHTFLSHNSSIGVFSGAGNRNYCGASVRMYYARIWSGNTIGVDLRPARRDSDGVIGMYDLVSRTFKTNSGSGSFIAGPELAVGKGGGKSLPEEYQQVEYLESEDNVNCYINTGFAPNNNTRLTASIYPTSTRADAHFWFGSRNGSSSSQAFVFYQGGSATSSLNAAWNTSGNVGLSLSGQKWYDIDFNKNVLKVNGSTAYTFTSGTFTGIYPIFLFAMDTSGSMDGQKGGQRIQNTKIYDNGTIVRNFIPCYRKSDMKPGMYDTVNGVFYTNAGSGEFILGPTVSPYYSWEPNAQGGSFNYFQKLRVGGRTSLINGDQGFTATFTANDTYNFMDMYPLLNGYKFTFSCDVSGLPSGGYWYFNLWNDEATHPWKLQNGHNTLTTLITTDRIKNYNTNAYTQLNQMLWDDGTRSTPDNSSTIRVENIKIYQGIYDTPKYAYFHNVSTTYDSRFGWVADFNGSAIEMLGLQTLLKGGENFTFSIWFKRNSGSGWQTIWGCNGFELEAARSGSFTVVAYNWGQSSSGGITYSSGEWHHLVMTRNTTETKFYLDGVLGYTGTAHNIPNTPLYLGAWANPKSQNFTGQMANMMLFDTVLTADQVKELYGQ